MMDDIWKSVITQKIYSKKDAHSFTLVSKQWFDIVHVSWMSCKKFEITFLRGRMQLEVFSKVNKLPSLTTIRSVRVQNTLIGIEDYSETFDIWIKCVCNHITNYNGKSIMCSKCAKMPYKLAT